MATVQRIRNPRALYLDRIRSATTSIDLEMQDYLPNNKLIAEEVEEIRVCCEALLKGDEK